MGNATDKRRNMDWLSVLEPYRDALTAVPLKKGTLIDFTDGERPCYIFFLLRGSFKVCGNLPDGRQMLYMFAEAFMIFGEMELLQGNEASLLPVHREWESGNTVQMMSDGHALRLNYDAIREKLLNGPAFMRLVAVSLAEKINYFSKMQLKNTLLPAESRVASYLLGSAGEDGMFNENQKRVSEQLCISYRHLHRILNDFCAKGYLENRKRCYCILDPEGLRTISEQSQDSIL